MELTNDKPSQRGWWQSLARWFDNEAGGGHVDGADPQARQIDWPRVIPFIAVHLACGAVVFVGTSAFAVLVAAGLYALRMFAITGFYHRYFSHRAFRTSRAAQFAFALLGAASVQRGPLWWASHHRHHHVHSDAPDDVHSAREHGFLWSHMGWFMTRGNFAPRSALVGDLARYPELRFIDRYDVLAPFALAAVLYAGGEVLARLAPGLGTDGLQLLVWGFCISTVVLYHATFTTNSLAHRFGRRRYATPDDSRNNAWLALIKIGRASCRERVLAMV
jgi:stearoyl-CoA desaturase (delta-9 desaturase)